MAARPRHVLITGGSRGIGLAIAQLFAKTGYRCTLISRSEEALKTAVSTLQPLSNAPIPDQSTSPATSEHTPAPFKHTYIPGDISTQTHFWTSHPSTPFGSALPKPPASNLTHASRIDVLVNCAGITQSQLLVRTTDEDVTKIVNTNLTAMMLGTKFLIRQGYLRGQGPSSTRGKEMMPVVINVASLLGLQGGYGAVAYATSKAGVLGFTRALATEYASHHVRVNAIVPGYIETEMTRELDEEQLRQRIPLGRFGTPDEVAQAALFLAQNQYAHNCVVNLDGGLSAV